MVRSLHRIIVLLALFVGGAGMNGVLAEPDLECVKASGTCGAAGNEDNVTWSLSCDSVLTISGTGAMKDWNTSGNTPWYAYKDAIRHLIVEKGVTTIGNFAFMNCHSLETVSLPDGLTQIGYTKWNASNSTSGHAFYDCSRLRSVVIPADVTTIGRDAFLRCKDLESIQVEQGNMVYDSRDNCNAVIETATNLLLCGCKNTVIPNSVTAIFEWVFEFLPITSMTIPAGVTSIGKEVFKSCNQLKDLYLEWTEDIPLWSALTNRNPQSAITIHVPCSATGLYKAADGWKNYTVEGEGQYTITAASDDNTQGSVTVTVVP